MPNEQSNQSKEVVDIFAGLDRVPERVAKAAPAMQPPRPEMSDTFVLASGGASAPQRRGWFKVGVALIIFLVVLVVAIIVLKFVLGIDIDKLEIGKPETATPATVVTPEPTPPTAGLTPVTEETAPAPVAVQNEDSDSDGLTDAEEIAASTNPLKVDTDNDKLFDYDEVKVYLTDPLAPDTDADSYLDGEEVLNGYNPKGPGKLLNFQEMKK